MKQRMQGMVIGILVMTLLFGTITVFAAANRTIEVTFGNVRTTLFGQEFVVRDAQGLVIEPFMYNDRAYVPVDTVLHAMGANAQWNADTGTLNFGTGQRALTAVDSVRLKDITPFEAGGFEALEDLALDGQFLADAVGFEARTNRNVQRSQAYSLGGDYSLFKGDFFVRNIGANATSVWNNRVSARIIIVGDGQTLFTYTINHQSRVNLQDTPVSFEVDVTNINTLNILIEGFDIVGAGGGTVNFSIGIGNGVLN